MRARKAAETAAFPRERRSVGEIIRDSENRSD